MHIHARTPKCGFSDLVLLEVRPSETQLVRIEIFRDAEDPRHYHFIHDYSTSTKTELCVLFKLHCRKRRDDFKIPRVQKNTSFYYIWIHLDHGELHTRWGGTRCGVGAFQRQHGVATQSLQLTLSCQLLVGKMLVSGSPLRLKDVGL